MKTLRGCPLQTCFSLPSRTGPVLLQILILVLLGQGSSFAQGNGGTLLKCITNPVPAAYDHFGGSVAALGTDKVLVGAKEDIGPRREPEPPIFSARTAPC
jgi:hypothetical protein